MLGLKACVTTTWQEGFLKSTCCLYTQNSKLAKGASSLENSREETQESCLKEAWSICSGLCFDLSEPYLSSFVKIHQVAIKHNELLMNGCSGGSWEGTESGQALMIVTVGHGGSVCYFICFLYICNFPLQKERQWSFQIMPRPTIAVLVILRPSFKPVLLVLFESKQAWLKLSHRDKN